MPPTPMPRQPTVSARSPRALRLPGAGFLTRRGPTVRGIGGWLAQEFIALAALSGAALTVIGQLSTALPLAPVFAGAIERWQDATRNLWRPPLEALDVAVHPDIVAALSVAVFMAMLGLGARVSARLAGQPLDPLHRGRFFDDQTWPSLIVFAALCMTFLIGHDQSDALPPPSIFGSEEFGKNAFAVIVTAGYFAGDFIGHRAFHLRLYRLAAIVIVFSALNFAMVRWA